MFSPQQKNTNFKRLKKQAKKKKTKTKNPWTFGKDIVGIESTELRKLLHILMS